VGISENRFEVLTLKTPVVPRVCQDALERVEKLETALT
jgi:hypothetical protein